ncbi:MAG: hypothetical protein ABR588_08410 [Sphingomicrobium sp.]|nr:hypothetical protein [Sphingomonadales bacterium]
MASSVHFALAQSFVRCDKELPFEASSPETFQRPGGKRPASFLIAVLAAHAQAVPK